MDWTQCTQLHNGIPGLDCLPIVGLNITNFLYKFAAIASVFYVMWAGLQFILSRAKPDKIAKAKKTLIYAIIGFLVIFGSYAILNFVGVLTGGNISNSGPSNKCTNPPDCKISTDGVGRPGSK